MPVLEGRDVSRFGESVVVDAQGKTLPHARSPARAAAAKENVADNKGKPRGRGNGKGDKGGKGDPNARPCWKWQHLNECDWGADCRWRKNAPGRP